MFKYLILLNALVLSGVAAYYSVLGLMTIFAAAAIPVAIMGSALEAGKLVTATFLHNHWKSIGYLMRTYLTTAVVALMLITSLGIFGLLSKANIDTNLNILRAKQTIEQIDRQVGALTREQQESELAATTAREQSLNQSNDEIDLLRTQLQQAQDSIDALDRATELNDVKAIQTLAGVAADGSFGPNTQKAVQAFRLDKQNVIDDLNQRIRLLNDRLDERQITIEVIDNSAEIRTLTVERFTLERDLLSLEAEVGPIKFISELVYGSSEGATMDESVRMLILIIVLVFDPLAISLLLAFNALNNKGRKHVEQTIEPIQEERTDAGEGDRSGSDDTPEEEEAEDTEEYGFSDSEEDLDYWKKVVEEQHTLDVAPKPRIQKPRGKMAKARKNLI